MNINQMYPGTYLKGADFARGPQIFTIASITMETLGQGQNQETKPVLRFSGIDQGMALNVTNGHAIATLYGDETNDWIGKPIEVYFDPNIMMKGERKGGLRVRAPSGQAMQSQPQQPVQAPVQSAGVQSVANPMSAPQPPQQIPVAPQTYPQQQVAPQPAQPGVVPNPNGTGVPWE